ncbi:CHAT domain-containing protein [Dongia sp.]|uniref:CHAT domain-containing protein n=1 Tax=Dongia sp. TaxID=1977262 RepID=UPI0035B2F012
MQDQVTSVLRMLGSFSLKDGSSPFSKIIVVAPSKPDGSEDVALKGRLAAMLSAAQRNTDPPLEDGWIEMATPIGLNTNFLVALVERVPARTAVVITEAARYRAKDVSSFTAGEDTLGLREDLWVPHLHATAQSLYQAVEGREVYFILLAGELAPRRAALGELLTSLDGVGVVGATVDVHLDGILADNKELLSARVIDGRLGALLNTIDGFPAALDSEKPFLKIQLLHRSGLIGQAMDMIEDVLRTTKDPDPPALVKLALIARQGGAFALASRLLHEVADILINREMMSLAMGVAYDIGEHALAVSIAHRIDKLYPGDPAVVNFRVREAIGAANYGLAADVLLDDPSAEESVTFFRFLERELSAPGLPDYLEILDRARRAFVNRVSFAHRALIRDGLRRGALLHALTLALQPPEMQEEPDIKLLVEVLERVTLERNGQGGFIIDDATLQRAIQNVIGFLSQQPLAHSIRVNLTRLLSVPVTGHLGIALIAFTTLGLMARELSMNKLPQIEGFSAQQFQQRKDFIEKAFAWMEGSGALVMGRAALPEEMITEPADLYLPMVENLLMLYANDLGSPAGDKVFNSWLLFSTCLAKHSSNPNRDLWVIRMAAARLAAAGKMQTARDLAQVAMESAGADRIRQRVAWSVVADIYHRLGNNLEALLALACAGAGDVNVSDQQAWQEADTLARLLRDVGLYDEARRVVEKSRLILLAMDAEEANSHRLDLLLLQIDYMKLRQRPGSERSDVIELLSRGLAIAGHAIEVNDDAVPIAVVMAQLLQFARTTGVKISSEVEELFKNLQSRLNPIMYSLVSALSAHAPTAEDTFLLHQATERARYSEDAAFDVRHAVLAAQRLLEGTKSITPDEAAFAIEIMSDRAIALPGWELSAKPAASMANIGEASEMACALSMEGITVVMAGATEAGGLVWVSAQEGKLGPLHRESEQVFSIDKFRAWEKNYPYGYGTDDDVGNKFILSLDGLGISELPNARTVVIAEAELQKIPVNILLSGDSPAGSSRPMASAPSLGWLHAARMSNREVAGRTAWISTAGEDGQTLKMIADRLSEDLLQHRVTLNNDSTIPEGLMGSELVIVAAHGGLLPDRSFFQRVSDEGSTVLSVSDFSDALRNIGVVLLFVCSGGRADKHPSASTVVGLTKHLLDRGCTAVVASPWPLSSNVPAHWLPAFLEAWKGDVPLIDAVFIANKAVGKALGDALALTHAMTVFGDPLRRASSSVAHH